MTRKHPLLTDIWDALTDPPDWFGWIVLMVWGVATFILAFTIYFGAASTAVLLTLAAAALFLPWIIYYALLFTFLAAAFVLGAIFQLIAWAGRAWRGEPLFGK